jgi:hypothetical protein
VTERRIVLHQNQRRQTTTTSSMIAEEEEKEKLRRWLRSRIVTNYAHAPEDVHQKKSLGMAVMLALAKQTTQRSAFNRRVKNMSRVAGDYVRFCSALSLNTGVHGEKVAERAAGRHRCIIRVVNYKLDTLTVYGYGRRWNDIYIAEGPDSCYYPTNRRGFVRLDWQNL